MKTKINDLLTGWPLQWISALILGGVFIWASIDKIAHPHQFAYIIHNYKLLPDIFVHFAAISMPWAEMIAGLCVVSGLFRRAGSTILGGLLLIFSIAISINLIRGLKFDCGCFTTVTTDAGSDPVGLLIRDAILLIPTIILVFFHRKKNET